MKFEEMNVVEYEDLLASKKSTPGGGSALALVLVNAISLCQMVCNFTIDKKGYEDVKEEMISFSETLKNMKVKAYDLFNQDSESFTKLMDAYKSKNDDLIAEASIFACQVPYELYLLTLDVEKIAVSLSSKGNKNVTSDSKIAMDLCESIYHGCTLNVKANIKCIRDSELYAKYSSIL